VGSNKRVVQRHDSRLMIPPEAATRYRREDAELTSVSRHGGSERQTEKKLPTQVFSEKLGFTLQRMNLQTMRGLARQAKLAVHAWIIGRLSRAAKRQKYHIAPAMSLPDRANHVNRNPQICLVDDLIPQLTAFRSWFAQRTKQMDYSYALGDQKCNLPDAGSRQDAHYMLEDLFSNRLGLSSELISRTLEEMGKRDSGFSAHRLGLVEQLVMETIRLRDRQSIEAIRKLPGPEYR
jgi:hypothetical protein